MTPTVVYAILVLALVAGVVVIVAVVRRYRERSRVARLSHDMAVAAAVQRMLVE